MTSPIDSQRFLHELALRGLSQKEVAHLAGLPEMTVSRAVTGRRITAATLQRIADALIRLPVRPGMSLVLAQPTKKAAAEVER